MVPAKMRFLSEPIDRAAYRPYGDLIAADESREFVFTNMGTAKRFNHLCDLKNLRPDEAKLNVCVFRCSPYSLEGRMNTLEIRLLERHAHSTQLFVPMSAANRYLAVVALGNEAPDLSTLRAFLIEGSRAVSYHPGVWHHPMIALDKQLDFTCFVWEAQTPSDCEVVNLEPMTIQACP
jgi:ureidoglycolate lyase